MLLHPDSKLYSLFGQQVQILGDVYRDKHFSGLHSSLLSPVRYKIFRKKIFLHDCPFSISNQSFGIGGSCTSLLWNLIQLLGATGSYYATKKYSCFLQNLLRICYPTEICIRIQLCWLTKCHWRNCTSQMVLDKCPWVIRKDSVEVSSFWYVISMGNMSYAVLRKSKWELELLNFICMCN